MDFKCGRIRKLCEKLPAAEGNRSAERSGCTLDEAQTYWLCPVLSCADGGSCRPGDTLADMECAPRRAAPAKISGNLPVVGAFSFIRLKYPKGRTFP